MTPGDRLRAAARLDPALREALAVLLDALGADADALPRGCGAALDEVRRVLDRPGLPTGVEALAERRRATRRATVVVPLSPVSPRWSR